MIRFYRKKIRLDQFPTLHTVQHHQILQLIVILRLAVLLNQKRTPDQGVSLTVTAKQNSMFLKFNDTWLKEHTLLLADLQQEQKYLKKVGFLLDFH
jgi:exopolyphosphatase/guanosine-5'-triphosphate,3'-diphosphate pyrophosphatase